MPYSSESQKNKKRFHLHLISDSTGETVSSVARSAISHFEGVEAEEHVWSLVRSKSQLEKAIHGIEAHPGVVMYTMVDATLQDMLKEVCQRLNLPCIPILARVVTELSTYLGVEVMGQPGRQHELNEDYFTRMDAINYTLMHDDGQVHWELEDADIVLVGVSRTSKSPTCIYLAYRGLKAANIPFVASCPLPPNLENLRKPLIVGLTINPDRLIQIRKTRMQSLNQEGETNYVDMDEVKQEILESRRLFARNHWPVIDVTKRSVEETAATIMQFYHEMQEKRQKLVNGG